MSDSESWEPSSRPRRSAKALGKRRVVDPPESDLEVLDSPHRNIEEENAELFDEEAEDEGQPEASAPTKFKTPEQGLLTTTRFQVPAHPEHLSPFESILLNNQQLLVEAMSGVNSKVDFIISNIAE